jgi:hypothetical protein
MMIWTDSERLAAQETEDYPMPSPNYDCPATMSTVYLIAQPTVKRDGELPVLTPLGQHGTVKTLINTGEYPSLHPERCLKLIEQRLANFNPAEDYIAWAGGDTLAAVLLGVVLAKMGIQNVRWLKYQRGWGSDGERDDTKSYYRLVEAPLVLESEKLPPGTPDPRD